MLPGTPEDRIKVFVDGSIQTYYASQLQGDDQGDGVSSLSSDQFHAYLTALQIRYPGLSTLYSLNAARVDFIPYQFRPVLKFIRSDRPRLLIADGVGVGKTIEAGLILRELQARREIQSVLIICPRPLVTERKWEKEMRRFDQRFTHLDGRTLRYCISEMDLEGEWPERHQKAILPYSLFDEVLLYGPEGSRKRKRGKGLLDLDPPPRFDLVIVDEAHHIRNQHTYAHKAVRFFATTRKRRSFSLPPRSNSVTTICLCCSTCCVLTSSWMRRALSISQPPIRLSTRRSIMHVPKYRVGQRRQPKLLTKPPQLLGDRQCSGPILSLTGSKISLPNIA